MTFQYIRNYRRNRYRKTPLQWNEKSDSEFVDPLVDKFTIALASYVCTNYP